MKQALRIARLERLAARAREPGCSSCAGVDLCDRRGVIREVAMFRHEDGVSHYAHCLECAQSYRGRIVGRTNEGVQFEDLVTAELPV